MSGLLLPGVISQVGPLQRIIAAEYAGQEESGPMLRTWGKSGPEEIPAFNSPGTASGPGGLSARECLVGSEQYFSAMTTLADLRSGPMDFWLWQATSGGPIGSRIGATSDLAELSSATVSQWTMLRQSGGRIGLYALSDTGSFSSAGVPDNSWLAETWTRWYIQYVDDVMTLRWHNTQSSGQVTLPISLADATHFSVGAVVGGGSLRLALIRKYNRPLTEEEHTYLMTARQAKDFTI